MSVSAFSSTLCSSSASVTFPIAPIPKNVPKNVLSVMQFGTIAPMECEGPTGDMFDSAFQITRIMTPEMSTEQFDQLIEQYPEYRLSNGNNIGCTVLDIAIGRGYSLSFITHILDCEPSLINRGFGYKHYSTPLMRACNRVQSLMLLRLFESRGAHINLSDNLSRTPLSCAAESGNFDAMKYLLLRGGVVYEAYFQKKEELFFVKDLEQAWRKECQDSFNQTCLNLAQAIEELWGVQCFKNGTLHSKRNDSLITRLPSELRLKIGSFVQD